MEKVKYRLNDPGLAPRRTSFRFLVGGASGSRAATVHGNRSGTASLFGGARYGVGILYPFEMSPRSVL